MIESKFYSMGRSSVRIGEWDASWRAKKSVWTREWNCWLEANGICKLKCGWEHFNPRDSNLIYVINPAHRLMVAEEDLLAVDKEFAMKALVFGALP